MADEIFDGRRVAPGMVRARSADGLADYGDQVWTEGRSLKHTRCKVSGTAIKPGDRVYRPVTNRSNRSWRVLASVMDAAVPAGVEASASQTKPAHTPTGKDQ